MNFDEFRVPHYSWQLGLEPLILKNQKGLYYIMKLDIVCTKVN